MDLKSQIESLMSSYLSEHKWSSSLKKSDIRERARRHIETFVSLYEIQNSYDDFLPFKIESSQRQPPVSR